ncbi:class IV adenylate cyclase [Aeromonas salmonicida]|uniref:class IV adenylate cyclase n=1 Tax=Aeromonas salmonicida TaxID=645 RepID=UPI0038BB6161
MSQDHFQGRYEVEFKYRLDDRPAFISTLKTLDPEVMLQNNLEQDSYFNTPEPTLAIEGKSLVIRTMQPSGIKLWIVKGPKRDRCEAVNITDADKAASMLQTLGYQQVLAIMTDDETLLPSYRQQLQDLATRLGLSSRQLETRSYRTLCEQSLTLNSERLPS